MDTLISSRCGKYVMYVNNIEFEPVNERLSF
jgi:hypothetical protein